MQPLSRCAVPYIQPVSSLSLPPLLLRRISPPAGGGEKSSSDLTISTNDDRFWGAASTERQYPGISFHI
jgi:hypothetical protein